MGDHYNNAFELHGQCHGADMNQEELVSSGTNPVFHVCILE